MIQPQYFLHVANILFVLSYSVRDMMWLRVLALCGVLISLPYYYLQPEVLWQPIGWAAVFLGINGYHVWRLWLERRPVELSADEARLYELTFFPLARRRFAELARLGRWVRPGGRRRPGPPGPARRGGRGAAHRERRGQGRGAGPGAVRARRGRRRRGRLRSPAAVRGGRRRGLPRPAGARRRDQAARREGTTSSPARWSGSRARTSPASWSACSAKPRRSP